MKIKIRKLDKKAKLPVRAHSTDAGMDLFALRDTRVPSKGSVLVSTGIAMQIPDGYVGLIWPKSGLAVNEGIDTLAGVIDSSYRGEIKVLVHSVSGEYLAKAGTKIAQILIQKIELPELVEVDELDDTSRGEGGFGSTGI